MKRTVHTEYRIISKKPGEADWEYRAFTQSKALDRETAQRYLDKAIRQSPIGWEFKIERARVTTYVTDWEAMP